MGDLAVPVSTLTYAAREQGVSYERWCQCARLLLGWDGDGEIGPELYAAGLTPLAAARAMVLGRG